MANVKQIITQAVIRQWETAGIVTPVRWANEGPEKHDHYQNFIDITLAEKTGIGLNGNITVEGVFTVEAWTKRSTGMKKSTDMLNAIEDLFKYGTVLTESGLSFRFGVSEPTNDNNQDNFFVSALDFPFITHYNQ